MRIRSRFRAQLLFAAAILSAGCALDSKGLAPTTGDASAGNINPTGTGGAIGTGGALGTGGAIGTGGVVGTGGLAGSGGAVATGGAAASWAAVVASARAGRWEPVEPEPAPSVAVALGTGGGAVGGRGGATVTCGPSTCPNGCCSGNTCVTNRTNTFCGPGGAMCAPCAPCFQCSANGTTCALNQASQWTLSCVSATIAPQKPGPLGPFWDLSGPGSPPTATAPDRFCEFQLDRVGQADTGVLTDTFSPMWNQSIAPTNTNLTPNFLISQAGNWSIFVGDDDGGLQRFENVCTVSPMLTAANFTTGIVKFANVQSCTSLTIQLVCAQN